MLSGSVNRTDATGRHRTGRRGMTRYVCPRCGGANGYITKVDLDARPMQDRETGEVVLVRGTVRSILACPDCGRESDLFDG